MLRDGQVKGKSWSDWPASNRSRLCNAAEQGGKCARNGPSRFLRPQPDGGGSHPPLPTIADREEAQRCHDESKKDENPNEAKPHHMHFAQFGPPAASVRFETLDVLCICVLIPAQSPDFLSGPNRRSEAGRQKRPEAGRRHPVENLGPGGRMAHGGRSSLKMADVGWATERACSEPGSNRARCEDLG